ncbi:hypothetical protein CON36_33090 [Bacillus cereus]|uniref:Uncharacterized protein n=1 Tax=Bacillus cereus TaxID=1396 RepID=A0A9X6SSZ4_BACCE|nr:hypothetical protein [Bacillus cereus]PDZ94571.1 hypothetical protein CON36_33090 [Bacillus cereus]PGP14425.1 hypothetical protein COA01_29100 [Bacillus cereus]
MMKEQKDLWSMNTVVEDDSFDLNIDSEEERGFVLETKVVDDSDDFFQEFNRPSQVEKKKTKQERLHEYKKINTKLPSMLHRMLKTYCSQQDLKKNDVFKEALTVFMKKHKEDEIVIKEQVNGALIDVNVESTQKKAYNFEVEKEFFKEIKTYASMRDLKMIVFYEQAIIEYLHEKRFSF